ncbi:MAG TPA: CopD family protein [Sphingobium sp.]|uniref:CopD family protein n=1 Tax=Sphingobium sp. TaxID=1912891 RepID=UPI002ED481A3
MVGFLGLAYPWVLAAHIIFVIFLMASLFMMPRFFIYHHQAALGSPEDKAWIEREARLKRIIMNPSLIIVWVLGIALALNTGAFSQGWFHVKLLLVLILSGYHGWAVGYAKKLARGERPMAEKTLRLLNEVPGILVAAIVVTVIAYGPHHSFG